MKSKLHLNSTKLNQDLTEIKEKINSFQDSCISTLQFTKSIFLVTKKVLML